MDPFLPAVLIDSINPISPAPNTIMLLFSLRLYMLHARYCSIIISSLLGNVKSNGITQVLVDVMSISL